MEEVESRITVESKENAAAAKPPPTPLLPPKKMAPFSGEQVRRPPFIPEIMVTMPDNTQLEPSTNRRYLGKTGMKAEDKEEFLYLNSTPFTPTMPSFRHGPILFSKAEVSNGMQAMDNTLDWTAFQMAILGAGGLLEDLSEEEEDIEQVEEITSWFDTFGFETYGVLITEEVPEPELEPVPSTRLSSHSTLSSTSSTIDREIDLPIPAEAEFPSGFWNIPVPGQALSKAKFFNSTGLKR
ncbi:hypothetical protein ACKAV7_008414 [Fusarium commune]